MQNPNEMPTDRFDLGEKYVPSNNLPTKLLDDSSIQDAAQFNDSGKSIDANTQEFNDSGEKMAEKSLNIRKVLSINVSNCFKDLKDATILSPVSELAMNVALTKLVSTDPVTGKFKSQVSCFYYCANSHLKHIYH